MPGKPTNLRGPEFDAQMMRRALSLALRGQGRVEPNPMVGCVLVRNGGVIGEGHHRRHGAPHAEVEALRRCGRAPKGATAYVTLEPCCHVGKTPPCTDALIDAGVARVVIGMRDPHPLVAGKGIRRLKRAGVTVEVGLLANEAKELIAPFRTLVKQNRPFVIAKWAQSLDGKLATRTGDSRWISCAASRRLAHRLRARVDAVIVGSGTIVADDPRLTARGVQVRRHAARVVLDGRLRTAESCRLVQTAGKFRTLIVTTPANAASPKAERLRKLGVEVLRCRSAHGRTQLRSVLQALAERAMTNVLVEGGPTLLASLFSRGLVDEAHVFTAPILVGGGGATGPLDALPGSSRIAGARRARSVRTRSVGTDTYHILRFT